MRRSSWLADQPIHILLNPVGGGGAAERRWLALEPRAREILPNLAVHRSTGAGGLTDLARELVRRPGVSIIIAAGGDGTSHEVINGFLEGGGQASETHRMGWLPLGSGNDLARSIGFGNTGRQALAAYQTATQGSIDFGRVEFRTAAGVGTSRYFGNSFTLGVSADALDRANRSGRGWGGRIAYLSAAARALLTHRPEPYRLTVDGQAVAAGPMWLVSVTNGPTLGAGMRITPDARLDDGALDLLWIEGIARAAVMTLLPRVYWGGHLAHRGVRMTRARSVVIEGSGPLWFEIDGELGSGTPPFRISVVDRGLPIVRPGPVHVRAERPSRPQPIALDSVT